MVRVERIGTRATTVRTKQEQDRVIPNARIVQSSVANCTRSDTLCRIDATIGVDYDSDLDTVRRALEGACRGLAWISDRKEPAVHLRAFDVARIEFKVLVGIEDPWSSGGRTAELREALWRALREARVRTGLPAVHVCLQDPPA